MGAPHVVQHEEAPRHVARESDTRPLLVMEETAATDYRDEAGSGVAEASSRSERWLKDNSSLPAK